MTSPVIDQPQRTKALDPSQSFIVQAPAGSGKTELLTQRFLALLSRVSAPEEVVAITFTRKAAMEMKERILSALNVAATQAKPEIPHAQKTWELASCVLKQNKQCHWNLLENPGRLRIKTIDGLAHYIVSQMPVLSEFTGVVDIAQNPDWLYTLAVRNLLNHENMKEDTSLRAALHHLMRHLNNEGGRFESLLKNMLERRDQWLQHIVIPKEREHLEGALGHLNRRLLQQCRVHFPSVLLSELDELFSFSEKNQPAKNQVGNDEVFCSLLEDEFWESGVSLRKLGNFLLKKDFQFRGRVDRSLGFPPESAAKTPEEKQLFKAMKIRFQACIEILKSYEAFRQSLQELLEAPSEFYTESQWETLSSLIRVLKRLLAELKLVFHEKKRVDFSEIMLAAWEALGSEDQPTELGLALDYKIQHLLIDEFQDTSQVQFKLIERLIAGWAPGDGRTLFLVGDPMQSIYRFRQAEVGLFLTAQQQGIAGVRLLPLKLTVNFRSHPVVLEWVNQKFSSIFPVVDHVQSGAVSFSPCIAPREDSCLACVFSHAVDAEIEGQFVAQLIQEKQSLDPNRRIAVLVRSKSHLSRIIPALLEANLKFTAVEVSSLKEQPVIYDLYSLTRVLFCPIDRLAWLSVLRAPWCGLTLADLHQLSHHDREKDFLQILKTPPEGLSPEGQFRFKNTATIIASAISNRGRKLGAHWVESVWLALKGWLCYGDENTIDSAKDYFDLLEKLEQENGFVALDELESRLNDLFAGNAVGVDDRLQLMTIHKSKGLEFDIVIIPGLERKPKSDTSPILRWLEQVLPNRESELILAPIKAVGSEQDSIYQYLDSVEKKKQKNELVRLLYVAATRARSELHWVACVQEEKSETEPSGSFLSLLSSSEFVRLAKQNDALNISGQGEAVQFPIKRLKRMHLGLSDGHQLAESGNFVLRLKESLAEKWGNVIHRLLDQLVKQGLSVDALKKPSIWKKWLMEEGCLPEEMPMMMDKIQRAWEAISSDAKLQWILDATRKKGQSEYAMTLKEGGHCQHLRMDCTFLDEKGSRWIIDFKTSCPKENQSIEDFLEEMKKKYAPQLEVYGKAMSYQGEQPVYLGLYFPLVPAWCQWTFFTANTGT